MGVSVKREMEPESDSQFVWRAKFLWFRGNNNDWMKKRNDEELNLWVTVHTRMDESTENNPR